jgi:hypothetical protein
VFKLKKKSALDEKLQFSNKQDTKPKFLSAKRYKFWFYQNSIYSFCFGVAVLMET